VRPAAPAVALAIAMATAAGAQTGSPAGPVPVERLVARRAALLERLGEGVAVVPAGKLRSIEGDYPQDSDYRESNAFFYLTGIEAPGARLVLLARTGAADSAILYLPESESGPASWTGGSLVPGPEAAPAIEPERAPLASWPLEEDDDAGRADGPEDGRGRGKRVSAQSRKFLNCSGKSEMVLRTRAMVSCRASFFCPVTRTTSPSPASLRSSCACSVRERRTTFS